MNCKEGIYIHSRRASSPLQVLSVPEIPCGKKIPITREVKDIIFFAELFPENEVKDSAVQQGNKQS